MGNPLSARGEIVRHRTTPPPCAWLASRRLQGPFLPALRISFTISSTRSGMAFTVPLFDEFMLRAIPQLKKNV